MDIAKSALAFVLGWTLWVGDANFLISISDLKDKEECERIYQRYFYGFDYECLPDGQVPSDRILFPKEKT